MNTKIIATLFTIASLLLVPSVGSASTDIVAYGYVTNISYSYGASGYIQGIFVTMENSDMSGFFTYVCRRPNLAPCLSIVTGQYLKFNAHLASFCSVQNKICGEAVIDSLGAVQ